MVNIDVFDKNGKKCEKIKLDSWENQKIKYDNLMNVALAYQANKRQGNASTKTKSEVAGSGAKQWKQKGTGRARAHYKQSNIWRGGYSAFGPKPKDYSQDIPKKQKKAALMDAWISKVNDDEVRVIKGLVFDEIKTKNLVDILDVFELNRKVLVITNSIDRNLYLSSRNMKRVQVFPVHQVNAEHLLFCDHVLIAEEAFQKLSEVVHNVEESKKEKS